MKPTEERIMNILDWIILLVLCSVMIYAIAKMAELLK